MIKIPWKNFWRKNWQSICNFVIFLILLISLLVLIFFLEIRYLKDFVPKAKIEEHDLAYYILAISLSTIIAFIAWFQLQNISKHQEKESKFEEAQFLLALDAQYSSKTILYARIIFQKIFVGTQASAKSLSHHLSLVAQEIINMEQNPYKGKEFIYLLNFIGFLETISFFIEKKSVTIESANELLGGTLKFFFEAFEPVIKHRREILNDDNYFKNFEAIYKKIKKLDPKNIPQDTNRSD